MRFAKVFSALLLVLAVSSLPALEAWGQPCTINFEGTCPNTTPECNASFSGGVGCISIGLAFCYSSGLRAYRVSNTSLPLTVNLSTGIEEITVFFAHTGAGVSGRMRFFDAAVGGTMVGSITTNGNCGASMPSMQTRSFSTPVLRIEVSVSGTGSAWIDDMTLTPATIATKRSTWGIVKTLYTE